MARTTIVLFVMFAASGCSSSNSQTKVVVDPELERVVDELPPFEDGVARSTCALSHDGTTSTLVLDELMIAADTDEQLRAFVDKYRGQILLTVEPPDGIEGKTGTLVRVDASQVSTVGLGQKLKELTGESGGTIAGTSESALRLLALATDESMDGIDVTLNWVMQADDIANRTTEEAPVAAGGFRDAFLFDYFQSGTTQDVGVGDAWLALERSGRIENKVNVAIIDNGFIDDPDIGFDLRARSFITFHQALDFPGPVGCGSGNRVCVPPVGIAASDCIVGTDPCDMRLGCVYTETFCAYHGQGAAGAMAGKHDNQFGAAGPASPVVDRLILAHTTLSMGRVCDALTWAVNQGADVINCSFGFGVASIFGVFVQGFAEHFWSIAQGDPIIFASAGNSDDNIDEGEVPGRDPVIKGPCEFRGVVCVGALDETNAFGTGKASFSNYGDEFNVESSTAGSGTVDIWAPTRIWVAPDPFNNDRRLFGGTSAASPFAAGVAALVLAADPTENAAQVMFQNANTGSADGRVTGWVNARESVLSLIDDVPPEVTIEMPEEGERFDEGDDIEFLAVIDDVDGDPIDHRIVWSYTRNGGVPTALLSTTDGQSFVRDDLCDGAYEVTARGSLVGGAASSATASFTITQPVSPSIACAPDITIVAPEDESVFPVGQEILLRAVFDDDQPQTDEPIFPIIWREGVQPDSPIVGMGPETTYRVTTGRDSIRAWYGTSSDFIEVTGVVTDNTAPDVSAFSPSGTEFNCNDGNGDSCSGRPIVGDRVRIGMVGNAQDEQEGQLPDESLRWESREVGTATWQEQGTGSIVEIALPIFSGSTEYEVRLSATDSDAIVPLTGSDSIIITILGLNS